MNKVYLISCSKTKQDVDYHVNAAELYTSQLFKKSVDYVRSVAKPTDWGILSAKYFFLAPRNLVLNYDETMSDKTLDDKKKWAETVYTDIISYFGVDKTFVFLCGSSYLKYLLPYFDKEDIDYKLPLDGLGIGQRLKWLKENTL